MEVNDTEILQEVKNGNGKFFNLIFYKYHSLVKALISKFIIPPYSYIRIDDLLQEIFLKVYKNIDKFDFELEFKPWLYKITKNVCINENKRKFNEFRNVDRFKMEILKEFDFRSIINDLNDLYILLDFKQYQILHFYLAGYNLKEVSNILNISYSNVKRRFSSLKSEIKNHFFEPFFCFELYY